VVRHGDRLVFDRTLTYAGRTNVFAGEFDVGTVERDYEVLSIVVTAAQAETANFGRGRISLKLTP